MSTSVKFLKAEAGKQSVFGTPVAPTMKMPFTGEYMDDQTEHVAEWDAGFWTPTSIVEKTSDYASFKLSGAMFFELLPVFFNAGFSNLTPLGAGPYSYDYALNPAAVGAPSPYTFYFGGNEAIGITGPAIRIADAYMSKMTLAFSMNSKEITATSEWFGKGVDDNSGAGFAFTNVAVPGPLGMMKGLLSTLEIDDAGVAGGVFTTMTAFECSILDWTLTIDTGLRAKWGAENNGLTYCGSYHEAPIITLAPVIRTTSANYQLVKAKADARTYQELKLSLFGAGSRQMIWKFVGRWLPNFSAHGRVNNEVGMSPVFQVETPYTMTTTPYYAGWELDTLVSMAT